MRTLTIIVAAIVAILATPVAMAGAYSDCFEFIQSNLGEDESILDEEAREAIEMCLSTKLRETPARATTTNTDRAPGWGTIMKAVVLQNASLAIIGHFSRGRIQHGYQYGYQYGYQLPRYTMYHDPHIGHH